MEKHPSKWISFAEIMKYHPDNEAVYEQMKAQLGQLVPFVGAGLSVPFYPQWRESLQEIARKVVDEEDRARVERALNRGAYLSAAELLSKLRGGFNLNNDFASLYSPEKLDGRLNELRRQSVYLLPALFPGLVVTTNLDAILKKVYQDWNRPFTNTFLPGERPSVKDAALREPDAHFLYSFHGSVDGKYLEERSVVFTKSQYRRHYRPWSALVRTLRHFYRRRPMLFLGCSLNRDRTLDVLRRVTGPGTVHYAIVNAAPGERDEKVRALGKLHIRAILFPTGQFESVRVILEKLLEETSPKEYHDLVERMSDIAARQHTNRFFYDQNLYSAVGRTEEIEALNHFVTDNEPAPFRWWAVTGPGGAGKSRLAWELTQNLPEGWKGHWITAQDYKNGLSNLSNPAQNTVYVADQVLAREKELGLWILDIATKGERTGEIRLLLLERNIGDWEERLRRRLKDCESAAAAEFSWKQPGFLTLKRLKDDELTELIRHYAEAVLPLSKRYQRGIPTYMDCEKIMNTLRIIDSELSPMYLLFLTDSWLSGEPLTRWNREDLLRQVLSNEESMIRNRVEQITGVDDCDVLTTALMTLWRAATILPDSTPEALAQLLPEAWESLSQGICGRFSGSERLLFRLGLAAKNGIAPLHPDVLGEFFVLHPVKDPDEEAARKALLVRVWQRPQETQAFYVRLISDFWKALEADPAAWAGLFPDPADLPPDAVGSYAWLLNKITFITGSLLLTEDAVSRLEALSMDRPKDSEFAILFANGLANLTYFLDAVACAGTVDRLEALTKDWPKEPAIAIEYSWGLFNLSNKQDLSMRAVTVDRLEALSKDWPEEPAIAIIFSTGLLNLIAVQNAAAGAITVSRLEALSKDWPKEPKIAILFANGLFSLSNSQDLSMRAVTVNRLEALSKDWPKEPAIAIAYAKGLSNLSYFQDFPMLADTVDRLEALSKIWQEESAIAIAYAKGLVNLAIRQDAAGAVVSVRRIESVHGRFPTELEMPLVLANGYYTLFLKQRHGHETVRALDGYLALRLLEGEQRNDSRVGPACTVLRTAADMVIRGDADAANRLLSEFTMIYKRIIPGAILLDQSD